MSQIRWNWLRRQRYVENAEARRWGRVRQDWRDRPEVTSFYFTRFPEEMGERDLWAEFKKWGDVREIFIAKNRNKSGRKYGFVRFKGVDDVGYLERKLDNLVVGGLKLHVNLPKHSRERTKMDQHHQRETAGDKMIVRNKGKEKVTWAQPERYDDTQKQMPYRQSYAKVLASSSHTGVRRGPTVRALAVMSPSHSTIQLSIPSENGNWYNKAWIGRLRNLSYFDRLEEEFFWDGDDDITPKYLGDDMVLLKGLSDSKAEAMCREAEENGLSIFHTLHKWSPDLKIGFRLVWILCWEIPLHAWNTDSIRQIVARVGDLVDVDDDTDDLHRLDRARVLIKTPWQPIIHHNVTTSINDVVYKINMVEETGNSSCKCKGGRYDSSSEEISFDESMMELSVSLENMEVVAETPMQGGETIGDKDDHKCPNEDQRFLPEGQNSLQDPMVSCLNPDKSCSKVG